MRSFKFSLMITLLSSGVLISCATTQTSNEVLAHKTDTQKNSKLYGSSIIASSLEKMRAETCPTEKKVESETKWKNLMSLANACISKNQWSMVEVIGNRLSHVEADAPWGAYYLSVAAEKSGFTERALWMIDLALKKADGIGILHYQKGRILWERQFYKEAISEIEKSLQLDAGILDAYLFLGQVHLRSLNFKKAAEYFQKVVSSDSHNYMGQFGLANSYIELEKNQEALDVLSRAISQYPRSLDLRLQEIYVYENLLKQPDVALNKYKNLQSLMASKKIDGSLPFDVGAKISQLENETQKMRQLASQKNQ